MNEEALFIEAMEIRDPLERVAFLDRTCAGDVAVRGRLERLLDQHERAGSFMNRPVGGVTGQFDPAAGDETASVVPREGPGTQIGSYKLLQQIGEGGMGTVFMAEQTHPVQRKVALKVIKAGMDSREVIARFEAERQALAMMDHMNIARVLDAGTTESGLPYFVMELVHGVPITKYCDDNRLTPRQRLGLFVPVCLAIQHAHQKGIIHRDIKPSNVMITLYDGKPVPKVIDFGVAKAIEQKLTERTLFTQYGTIVGTLEYMSPEQAEMSALGADTRSDIYSLGVLLYELLTGSTPLTRKRMNEAAHAEILRMIKEEEPPKPSTRLSESGAALASISVNRHMEPTQLSKLMRGELDWIVMKTLEKDRNRRYETANGFAMDVQRYLADEPVQACPPSAGYRFRKFARRNRGPVAAGVALAALLVLGTVGTSIGLAWALQAERAATAAAAAEGQQRLVVERQRNELAERNQALQAAHERERLLNERARQAIETVTSDTAIDQLTREPELRPEQQDFLDKMIRYYAESAQEAAATEQERSRQARAYHRMGRMNQILGRPEDSENAYRRAVALGQQLVADFPARTEFQEDLASSHNSLGVLLHANGLVPEEEAAYAAALALYQRLAAQFPTTRPEIRGALAGCHSNLSGLFLRTNRPKEAAAAQAESLNIRKQLAAQSPFAPDLRVALARGHNNMGWVLYSTGRPKEARSAYAKSLAIYKQLAAQFPDRPEFRLELARSQHNLGSVLPDRRTEAVAAHAEALAIQKQLAAQFPNRPEFLQELADGHNSLGSVLGEAGRPKEAAAAYAEALAVRKQLAAQFPKVPGYHYDVAVTLFSQGKAARQLRDFAAARKLLNEAIPYHLAALEAKPGHPDYRLYYRYSLVELTQSCAGQGDRPAALAAAMKLRDLGWDSAADAYGAAWTLAWCVPIVEKDEQIDAPKRQAEMQFYADQAMAMLLGAVAKGYKDIEHMKKNKDLDLLRQREDFKKLVAELDAKQATTKKP